MVFDWQADSYVHSGPVAVPWRTQVSTTLVYMATRILTLSERLTALTLPEHPVVLSLVRRSPVLRLIARDLGLSLNDRDVSLTLED